MQTQDFGYENEEEFVASAAVDFSVRRQLLFFITWEMKDVAHNLAMAWEVPEQSESALLAKGMSAFPRAFNAYLKYGNQHNAGKGHFRLYFTWWFRQAAAETFRRN